MKYTLILFIFLSSSLFFSCKKERLTKEHPEFIGNWEEQTTNSTYHKLHIEGESKGILSIYTVGNSDSEDHQLRKWRIKGDHLYYGIETDLGEISHYPSPAANDIPLGFNNDTIKAGTIYLVLKNSYYLLKDN